MNTIKIISILIIISLLQKSKCMGEESLNLIKNPGFEDTTKIKNSIKSWSVTNWGKDRKRTEIQFIAIPDAVEGKVAGQIKYSGKSKNLLIIQRIKTEGTKCFILKFKGKISKGKRISASIHTIDAARKTVQYEHSKEKIKGNNQWQEIKFKFTTKPQTKEIAIYLRATGGDAIFDNVSLVEVKN
jgi:hypothetical protein